MRRGSKHRRAARVKRRRKQLTELVGAHEALALLAGLRSVRDACIGLGKDDRARAREFVVQLQEEVGR